MSRGSSSNSVRTTTSPFASRNERTSTSGSSRVCVLSRARSKRSSSTASSGSPGAIWSITSTWPPNRVTRASSEIASSGRLTWWSVRAQPARSNVPLVRSSRVMSPSAKVTFGNGAARCRASSSSAVSWSRASTSATYGERAKASAPVPVPASSARSVPDGWTKRRTRSVRSARRSSSSSAICAAVSAHRFSDKLQRLLSRRDRARCALLRDELEQSPDFRALGNAHLVAAQERPGRLVLAGDPDRIGVLTGAQVGQRLERPRLGRPAEAVDRARRVIRRHLRPEQGVREPAELVRDRQPSQPGAERDGEPVLRRVELAQPRGQASSERLEQAELGQPLVPGGREPAQLVENAFARRLRHERRAFANERFRL